MAAAFRPVNSSLGAAAAAISEDDAMTPPPCSSTPRPGTAALPPCDAATTPTRATFSSAAAGQKPLPTSPFPQAAQAAEPPTEGQRRDNSQHSAKSCSRRDSMDVDMMDDSDGDDGGAGSDDESVNADGSKSSKKKKSQRFYCTDYPPCNLSFTRSEHLARHIRKHTGERPFQCHCSRRFSRLDNLRQHAQTVHVNEDIPIDSLAATGSRFQRQIRTERTRQAGNRARASTGGSAGGPARGHSKSLSTSSIASVGSVASSYSAQQPDARRPPPPLVMAADPRSRLSLESYRSSAESAYSYRAPSPGDFSTPTSATFSTAQSSPRWASGVASPTSCHSRSQSMYVSGSRPPGRRLSVPSGATPFYQPAHGQGQPGRPLFGPGLVNSSHPAALLPPHGGMVASPTAPATAAWPARRDSASSAADEAWRRRTWHPDSRGFGGGGQPHQLSAVGNQSVRPNPPPPIAKPSKAPPSFRLPGIESFDPVPRRNPSPMAVDAEPGRRAAYPAAPAEATQPDERRNLNMYDASLQRGLTRLDIGHKTPPRDSAGAWASEVNKAVQAQAERVRQNPPTVRFEDQLPPSRQVSRSLHQQTMSAPSFPPSREVNKRHGSSSWNHGAAAAAAASQSINAGPQAAAQDPRVAHVDRMTHPNLHGFSAFPARERAAQQQQQQQQQSQPQPQPHQAPHYQHQHQDQHQHPQHPQHPQHLQQQHQQQQDRPANADPLRRLEALVAVATSEGSTATAY